MQPVDPSIRFDQLPHMVLVSIIRSLADTTDYTDYLIFYGRYVQHMTLEQIADRLQVSKQTVRLRLGQLHDSIRYTYEDIMGFTEEKNYVVSTIQPDNGYLWLDE